jgi:hypothetical protein
MSVASRVERLCRRYGDGDLDELPEVAASALSRILARIRNGDVGYALLADLDLIDAALAAEVDGLTRPTRGYRPLAGMGGHPVAHVAVCPNGACSRRVVVTSDAGEPVECAILDLPLELIRLPT